MNRSPSDLRRRARKRGDDPETSYRRGVQQGIRALGLLMGRCGIGGEALQLVWLAERTASRYLDDPREIEGLQGKLMFETEADYRSKGVRS